jgi:hypothetical protein
MIGLYELHKALFLNNKEILVNERSDVCLVGQSLMFLVLKWEREWEGVMQVEIRALLGDELVEEGRVANGSFLDFPELNSMGMSEAVLADFAHDSN